MRTRLIFTGALMSGLFFVSTPAFSCKCPPRKSVKENYDWAGAVFSGRVISASERFVYKKNGERVLPAKRTFKIRILKSLKGKAAGTVTYEASSMCDVHFEKGNTYLIYAKKNSQLAPDKGPALIFIDSCLGTKLMNEAEEDIQTIARMNVESGERSGT